MLKNLDMITPTYIADRIDDSTMESGKVPHGIIAYELGYRAGWMAATLFNLDQNMGQLTDGYNTLIKDLKKALSEINDLKARVSVYERVYGVQEVEHATNNPNA